MKKIPVLVAGAALFLALGQPAPASRAPMASDPPAVATTEPAKPAPAPAAPASAPAPAPALQGKGDVITLNNMTVDKRKKEIRLAVRTAIDQGVLEYLLVGDVGKTYESVFKMADVKPSDFNFALLLLGFQPMGFEDLGKATRAGESLADLAARNPDSLLSVEVLAGGKPVDLYTLIRDRQAKNTPLAWVYTGGYFLKDGRYAPDWIWNFAAIWPDPASVLNLFSDRDNPYRTGGGLVMNEDNKELKKDQPYTLVIRRYKP